MTTEATPGNVPLNDQLGLVERLRSPSMTDTTATHIDRMRMAADEIERRNIEIDALRSMLTWAYSKLHARTFNSMDDALELDRIALYCKHDVLAYNQQIGGERSESVASPR